MASLANACFGTMPNRWPVSSSYSFCKRACELVVGLVGDDRQSVDERVVDAFAVLVDGKTQPTPDLLALAIRATSTR